AAVKGITPEQPAPVRAEPRKQTFLEKMFSWFKAEEPEPAKPAPKPEPVKTRRPEREGRRPGPSRKALPEREKAERTEKAERPEKIERTEREKPVPLVEATETEKPQGEGRKRSRRRRDRSKGERPEARAVRAAETLQTEKAPVIEATIEYAKPQAAAEARPIEAIIEYAKPEEAESPKEDFSLEQVETDPGKLKSVETPFEAERAKPRRRRTRNIVPIENEPLMQVETKQME
ncbi:MAG TPA: hypothetical protein PLK99_12665, partial [Burkholderiales bacterium]|nr:hypothetical protein [Burkholderiales bacterium]